MPSTSYDKERIPVELRTLPNWVAWRREERTSASGEIKITKVPYNARTGKHGKSNDPTTWSSFEEADAAFGRGGYDGVGFCLSAPYVGVDMDGCVDESIEPWAQRIIEELNSYTESSPSGTGVRIITKGELPEGRRQKDFKDREHHGLGLYEPSGPRFLTITGAVMRDVPIAERSEELRAIHQRLFPPEVKTEKPRPSAAGWASDDDLIAKARAAHDGGKFAALWDGKWKGDYPSQSEADLALCTKLAFWTGGDAGRIDLLFRRSGLMREKWNRDDYRENTIAKALELQTEFYEAPRAASAAATSSWPAPTPASAAASAPTPATKKEDWKKKALRMPEKKKLRGIANAIFALRNAPEWKEVLIFDEFSDRILVQKPTPWGFIGEWDDDLHDHQLQEWLEYQGVWVGNQIVRGAIHVAAHDRRCHPVREYLDGRAWDRMPRLDRWLKTYLKADGAPEEYLRAVGSKWLISAVARIYQPGCKVDVALMLEGGQDLFKSTALRYLSHKDDWFVDHLPSLIDKDSQLALNGKWIIELSELDAIKNTASAGRVKNYLSIQHDWYRKPWGHHMQETPRQCVFVGTTNHNEYLTDPTGGRRFWPVTCGEKIYLDGIRRDHDQLWAEAVHRFKAGEKWFLDTPELVGLAKEQQEMRYEEDPWEDRIYEWLERGHPEIHFIFDKDSGQKLRIDGRRYIPITTSNILQYVLEKPAGYWSSTKSHGDKIRIGEIMLRLKCKIRPGLHRPRQYVLPPEIRSKMLARAEKEGREPPEDD